MRPANRTRGVLAATVIVTSGLAGCSQGDQAASDERQAEVAERGAEVMGFDLEATAHRFEPTDGGGVQEVVARDPNDADEVAAVRKHLSAEAQRFAEGDFSDPAAIHGEEMPGLAELEASGGVVGVAYEEIDSGARVTYTADDPDLVTALHEWFDAQLFDHGAHAEPG